MGGWLGLHEISVIGETTTLAVVSSTEVVQIMADPRKDGPAKYIVMCEVEIFLKQGPSAQEATTDDFRLAADASMIITVDNVSNSYIAAISNGTDGTLRITRLDDKAPSTPPAE